MKKNIIKIEQLAALLFDDKKYNQFTTYIETNQINKARIMIDVEIDDCNSLFQHSIADKLLDLVMDLIINEMDGERESKQINPSTQ
jgi:hypothetical protein